MVNKSAKKHKLAILASHPVQYHAPLFKKLARHFQIDLTVYFCWDFGIQKAVYDPEFGKEIKWDIPLLGGYTYKFLKNYSPNPSSGFFGQINPGILKELITNNYDAIVIFGWNSLTNWLVFLTKLFHKTPLILRGESDLNKKIGFIKRFAKSAVLKTLFKFVDAFLYSYSLNKSFFKFYGVPDNKLFFYPCAVDNESFYNESKLLEKKRDFLKKESGIGVKDVVILFVGKLMERKRPMDLLKAYKIVIRKSVISNQGTNKKSLVISSLAANCSNAALLFVGDGALRPNLEEYAKEHNLKNVFFVGFKNQTEMSRYYAMADIFVLPSEFDPSPKVLNEVMNFGVPIITTTGVGTAEDLVAKGECGFLYEVGDIDKLAQQLKILTEDLKLRNKLGKNAFKTVKNWSFEKDIEGIIAALQYLKIN